MHLWLGEKARPTCNQNRGHERSTSSVLVAAPSRQLARCAMCCGWLLKARNPTSGSYRTPSTKLRLTWRMSRMNWKTNTASRWRLSVGRGAKAPCWRATTIVLRNGVVIESFGTGQRLRGRRRRENRPTLIVCDDLENDQHMASASATRENVPALVSWHATQGGNQTDKHHQSCHRLAPRRVWRCSSAAHLGGTQPRFRAILQWPEQHGVVVSLGGAVLAMQKILGRPSKMLGNYLRNRTQQAMDAGTETALARRRRLVYVDEDARRRGSHGF